jgi:hypothetical protein
MCTVNIEVENKTLLSNETNNTWRKGVFFPRVDDFSLMEVMGSFDLFYPYCDAGETVNVWVEMNGKSSTVRRYCAQGQVVGFFTIIFTLNRGVLESIRWEDSLCGTANPYCQQSSGWCIDDNCPLSSSSKINAQVYSAWYGDDAKFEPLESSGNTFANYREFSVGGFIPPELYNTYGAMAGQTESSQYPFIGG